MAMVRRDEVIASWSVLIGGGQGRAEGDFREQKYLYRSDQSPRCQEGKEKPGPLNNQGAFWYNKVNKTAGD
jgi:hypothetical protein